MVLKKKKKKFQDIIICKVLFILGHCINYYLLMLVDNTLYMYIFNQKIVSIKQSVSVNIRARSTFHFLL